jgi:hypothetical protein
VETDWAGWGLLGRWPRARPRRPRRQRRRSAAQQIAAWRHARWARVAILFTAASHRFPACYQQLLALALRCPARGARARGHRA